MVVDELETIVEPQEEVTQPNKRYSRVKLASAVVGGGSFGVAAGVMGGFMNQICVPSILVVLNDNIEPRINSIKEAGVYWGAAQISTYSTAVGVMGYVIYDQISSAIQKASEGNYTHLGIIVGTNIVSAGVELFRYAYKRGKKAPKTN